MNRKGIAIILAMALVPALSGCATVLTGSKDTIAFNTNPAGADLYIDGIKICTTPCETSVKRSINDKDVEFRLDGYRTKVVTLDKEFNTMAILNILEPLGFIVDAATGSIYKYDRKSYNIEMEQVLAQYDVEKIELNTVDKVATIQVAKK
jgi:hypothetical protein